MSVHGAHPMVPLFMNGDGHEWAGFFFLGSPSNTLLERVVLVTRPDLASDPIFFNPTRNLTFVSCVS